MTQGKLVVLEGIDGAGTTTQARLLVERLEREGIAAHLTCEPTTGPIGKLLRQILEGQHKIEDDQSVDQATLSLLFAADRCDHAQREVLPAMKAGAVVVSDRWYHSSLAYQGSEKERAWIMELNRHALRPDLTIFLKVDPIVAADRRQSANRSEEIFDDIGFQKRVAEGYDAALSALSAFEKIEVLDGDRAPNIIAKEIAAEVLNLLRAR